MAGHSFGWLEVDAIAEALAERRPEIDPAGLTFPRLRELVEALPDFRPQPGHSCNERILEAIQANWIEIRTDLEDDNDDDDGDNADEH